MGGQENICGGLLSRLISGDRCLLLWRPAGDALYTVAQ